MSPIAELGDIQLFESDAALLQPGHWLNDQLIAYYFEHLAQKSSSSVLLLEPSMSAALALAPRLTRLPRH
eukprot:7380952-Prymnesium_polylepis.2